MARLTVIEYAQAIKHLVELTSVSPFAETALGDVHCFYCHEYQLNVNEPVHSTTCAWENAMQFCQTIGLIE